jgi:1,4-dihydroxy-2-naphthoyl-CoA hydrolase
MRYRVMSTTNPVQERTPMTTDVPKLDNAWLQSSIPFAALTGVELVFASREEVRGRLAWSPERCTAGGVMHGGALMAFADTMGAACAILHLQPGEATSTIESKTNFFRAVREGIVASVSRPLHVGRTTVVVQTDLMDEQGRRVAQVTQTQAVLAAPAYRMSEGWPPRQGVPRQDR